MLALSVAAFWLIFVAELGDKTLFMVLLLSARYPPVKVFLGAALAFLLHAAIAVGLGQILAFMPHAIVKYGSAALFLFFGVMLLVRAGESSSDEKVAEGQRTPVWTSFLFIFIAEWGDMTQILSAALVADHSQALGRWGASLAVFAGAVLGLWLGTALAAFVGHTAGKWIPEKWVRRVAGVCFLGVAVYTALG
jgi:putative Ca2+/H+ antiporter (TMEM165/GDT1 family)